jgi:hypothetical protein
LKGCERLSKDIKEIFFDLYGKPNFLSIHITNQSLQKKMERFRDRLAVDFYNLKPEEKKQIKDFANKYLPDVWVYFQKVPIECLMNWNWKLSRTDDFYSSIKDYMVDQGQKRFKEITDKVIAGSELTDNELKLVNRCVLNPFGQKSYFDPKSDSDRYEIAQSYMTMTSIYALEKALYEWVILVSQRDVDVGWCRVCRKLFLKNNPGSEQIYCSNACKMKEYSIVKEE